MSSELVSTARPSALRLAGGACVALGAAAIGLGAMREWAAVGFVQDELGAADVPVHGVDVWEGKALLLAAVAALVLLIALRLARGAARRNLAVALIVLGAGSAAVASVTALRAEDRFGGGEGIDRLARSIATQVGQPVDVVRAQLREQFERDLRVDVAAGPWIAGAGGVVLAAGGALGVGWSRRTLRPEGRPG